MRTASPAPTALSATSGSNEEELTDVFQLIASLSVILPQLNVTKLKLNFLKYGIKTQTKILLYY